MIPSNAHNILNLFDRPKYPFAGKDTLRLQVFMYTSPHHAIAPSIKACLFAEGTFVNTTNNQHQQGILVFGGEGLNYQVGKFLFLLQWRFEFTLILIHSATPT